MKGIFFYSFLVVSLITLSANPYSINQLLSSALVQDVYAVMIPKDTVVKHVMPDTTKRISQSFELSSIEKGSTVLSVNAFFTLDESTGNECVLYLDEPSLKNSIISDVFVCNSSNSIPLDLLGVYALQTKLVDGNFNIKIKQVDINNSIAVDSSLIVLNVNYLKPTYFAKIENSIVTSVIVADSNFINTLGGGWVETDKSNYAGIGDSYINGLFIPPKPFSSWVLNDTTWVSPTPYPDPMKSYNWDEKTQSWVQESRE